MVDLGSLASDGGLRRQGAGQRGAGRRSALSLMRQRQSGMALRWAALVSFAVHAGVLAALLIVADRARQGAHEAIDATPMVELRMIEQKGQDRTTGHGPPLPDQTAKTAPAVPSAAAPPAPPPAPQPSATQPPAPQPPAPQPPAANSASPSPPSPPPPPDARQAEVLPLPPPPSPATPPSPAVPAPPKPQVAERAAPPRPPSPTQPAVPTQPALSMQAPAPASPAPPAPNADSAPRINLGGTDSLTNVLVEGDAVIPAGPDPKVRNREPEYPDEAVRRGEQGLVILLIRVSPQGLVAGVDIARSSGFSLLDRAARDAVVTWRFVPAVRDGQPVPSSMPLRVNFQLD
jgi:protein TonB